MYTTSDEQFRKIVADAIDNIPKKYAKHIKNLAFVVEEEPSQAQRQKLKLAPYQSLYGLYEGIPMTGRSGGYNLVLPDKITIFKRPIEFSVDSHDELVKQVEHTLWHEVAHYYGLGHGRIDELDNK